MSKNELKRETIHLYNNGWCVEDICHEYHVPRSTFYRWIKKSRECGPEISEDDIQIIRSKIDELEKEVSTYKRVLQMMKRDCE